MGDCLRGVSSLGIGGADNGDFKYAIEAGDDALDLGGRDVQAAGNDDVLHAVDEREIAVLVDASKITGVQPAVDQGFRGGIRIVPIFLHHRRAADQDLAELVRRQDLAVSINHAQFGEHRSEEHTSELQSLMRISYAVFCLKKKNTDNSNK